jgi:hypothetical protein
MRYIKDERPDEVIIMGDFLDFEHLSSFAKTNLRSIEGKTLEADYRLGNQLLDELHTAAPSARTVYLLGNHEHRVERYLDEHPQLRGLLEVRRGLRFASRGIREIRCYPDGEVYQLGKALFTHGLYTGASVAKKHLDAFGRCIFFGHDHGTGNYTAKRFGRHSLLAQSLGCLCLPDLSYMANNPSNWALADTTFHFSPSGKFNHYVSRIVDHAFTAPSGKVYR